MTGRESQEPAAPYLPLGRGHKAAGWHYVPALSLPRRVSDVFIEPYLREALHLVREQGWRVGNVDATIIAQAPKMASHIPQMVAHIAADLRVERGAVNVKATTTERLGFRGPGEGIAAQAVVLLLAD